MGETGTVREKAMPDIIRIYGFETSNNLKVRVALKYKGILFAWEPIDPFERTEIEQLSGQPLTPVMVHGDTVLFDSSAILRYLDANFPHTPRLFLGPRETIKEIERWETFARGELHEPMAMQVELRYAGKEDPELAARCQEKFDAVTEVLERALADSEWLVSGQMTAADVIAAPVVFRTTDAEFAALPEGRERTRAWMERVMAIDK